MRLYLDFASCADWSESCPEKCWRAQLTASREKYEPPIDAVYTYGHFAGSPGCPQKKKRE